MMEVIYLCGKDKKNIIATTHCKARFKECNSQGIPIIEIDNIMTAGIDFTDDYVKLLAEKICDMINNDIQNGLTGKYEDEFYKYDFDFYGDESYDDEDDLYDDKIKNIVLNSINNEPLEDLE